MGSDTPDRRFGLSFQRGSAAPRPVAGRVSDHLSRLEVRREAALKAGDMGAVAHYEDQIVRLEMFAMDLERWRAREFG